MKAEKIDRVSTDFGVLREDINTVFRRFRIHFVCGTQLFDRADHAVGLHSAELTGLDLYTAGCLAAVMAAGNASAD